MSHPRISSLQAAKIIKLYAVHGMNKSQISRALRISLGTTRKYLDYYDDSDLSYTDALLKSDRQLADLVNPPKKLPGRKSERLMGLFPEIDSQIRYHDCNMKQLWTKYYESEPGGYRYSTFVEHYDRWRKDNKIDKHRRNRYLIDAISPEDLAVLNKWRLSTDRRRWEKSVALLVYPVSTYGTDIALV